MSLCCCRNKHLDQAVTMSEPNIITVELEAEVALAQREDAFTSKFWTKYCLLQLWEQARVVWPLCGYVFVFKEAVLSSHTDAYATLFWAVNASVFGLAIFLDGLQVGIMPLSETLGNTLPRKASLPVTLSLAMVLGVGVSHCLMPISYLSTRTHRLPHLNKPSTAHRHSPPTLTKRVRLASCCPTSTVCAVLARSHLPSRRSARCGRSAAMSTSTCPPTYLSCSTGGPSS